MTTPHDRKRQDRLSRRQGIQDAARAVFAEHGFARASIEMISRRAGLSVGAIYLYFRSKEDLYLSLLEAPLARLDEHLAAHRAEVAIALRLPAVFEHLLGWAAESPSLGHALRLLAQPGIAEQLSPEVSEAVGAGLTRVRDHLGACVADGIHAGVYRPVGAAEVADLLWALLAGNLEAAAVRGNLALAPLAPLDAARRQAALVEASLRPAVTAALSCAA